MDSMRRVVVAILMATVIASCGGSAAETTTSPTPPPSTTTTTLASTTTTVAQAATYAGFDTGSLGPDSTLVAMARGDLEVFEGPRGQSPSVTLPPTTILGTATVVTVLEEPVDGWARVMLPIRPNGSEGWIAIDDVDLFVVEGRLVVDLSDKELTYFRDGEEVLRTVVAVGTQRNPTPVGHFYVTDNVTLANPNSAWGPHALGLSGRSDTITEYNGGDGIIGIHGTNRPDSIGNAASLGCVRLPNEMIAIIHALVAIGTPVEIRA